MKTQQLVVAVAAGVATACGGGTPGATPPQDVTITAADYALKMPDTLHAGRTIVHFVNNGTEMHQAQIVRLDSSKTVKDLMAAGEHMTQPWEVWVGGPNATAPHDSSTITVTLQPGHYVAVCFIPSPDGTPHVMKGMMTEFEVTGPAQAASPPAAADVVITTSDYTFDVAPALTSGRHTIRFENTGPQVHEVVLVQLQPDKGGLDLASWIDGGQKGPPPILRIYGMSSLSKGQSAEATFDLPPGRYSLICFLPDAGDGKPHVAHGMVKDFTVS